MSNALGELGAATVGSSHGLMVVAGATIVGIAAGIILQRKGVVDGAVRLTLRGVDRAKDMCKPPAAQQQQCCEQMSATPAPAQG